VALGLGHAWLVGLWFGAAQSHVLFDALPSCICNSLPRFRAALPLQLDEAGAIEAARQKRQEEIRARLAAGAGGGAAVAEDASVAVQQQAADYYTAEEMAKVCNRAANTADGLLVSACNQWGFEVLPKAMGPQLSVHVHPVASSRLAPSPTHPPIHLPPPLPLPAAVPEAKEEEGAAAEEESADGGGAGGAGSRGGCQGCASAAPVSHPHPVRVALAALAPD
jgi:hypothetical protein